MPAFVAGLILLLLSQTTYSMKVIVTAYCLRGTMANGHYVHPGAVATDPDLIPLGTRLYVPGYGMAKAEDTGSAVQGHHIDVWMASCSRAIHATRYNVPITIYP